MTIGSCIASFFRNRSNSGGFSSIPSSLVKRLGIEEGIELNPPLFDLFLKNDAMHDPMVNDSYCETFGWVSKENLARMRELTYKDEAIFWRRAG